MNCEQYTAGAECAGATPGFVHPHLPRDMGNLHDFGTLPATGDNMWVTYLVLAVAVAVLLTIGVTFLVMAGTRHERQSHPHRDELHVEENA
jgi:hypothetical protein